MENLTKRVEACTRDAGRYSRARKPRDAVTVSLLVVDELWEMHRTLLGVYNITGEKKVPSYYDSVSLSYPGCFELLSEVLSCGTSDKACLVRYQSSGQDTIFQLDVEFQPIAG